MDPAKVFSTILSSRSKCPLRLPSATQSSIFNLSCIPARHREVRACKRACTYWEVLGWSVVHVGGARTGFLGGPLLFHPPMYKGRSERLTVPLFPVPGLRGRSHNDNIGTSTVYLATGITDCRVVFLLYVGIDTESIYSSSNPHHHTYILALVMMRAT